MTTPEFDRTAAGGTPPSTGATGEAQVGRAQHGFRAFHRVKGFPDPTLVLATLGLVLAWFTIGPVQEYSLALFYGALVIRAWAELTGGVSVFRRVLGAAGLGYFLFAVAQALGS